MAATCMSYRHERSFRHEGNKINKPSVTVIRTARLLLD